MLQTLYTICHYLFLYLTILFTKYIGFIRSSLYNCTLGYFYTRIITQKVLNNLPDNSRILDIGIGTGYAYSKNASLIKKKNLCIVGIDIDAAYIDVAKYTINNTGLEQHIKLINDNIYTTNCNEIKAGSFDYVIFSDSYAVIPNVHDMITFCEKFLRINGRIIVVSTLFDTFNKYVNWIKQHIVYICTVEYGNMMVKKDLENYLADRKINNAEFTLIHTYTTNIISVCNISNRALQFNTYMVTWQI